MSFNALTSEGEKLPSGSKHVNKSEMLSSILHAIVLCSHISGNEPTPGAEIMGKCAESGIQKSGVK